MFLHSIYDKILLHPGPLTRFILAVRMFIQTISKTGLLGKVTDRDDNT